VGLLGGIGSGKSAVSWLLAEAGAVIVSGDEIGHEALRQPTLKARVVERWGADILDENGEVRRRKLGGIVFADAEEKRALERIVHPWIKQRLTETVARLKEDPSVPLVVVDAAVMLEAGWDGVCDELLFVDVPRELRLERIARQRGWSEKEVAAREMAQLPLFEKARLAHHTLDNSGTLEQLRVQIDSLLSRWGLARRTASVESTREAGGERGPLPDHCR